MRLHVVASGAAVFGAFVVVFACSGKTDSGATVVGRDASTRCPSATPAEHDACAIENLECEWGDDWDPRCNTVLQCSGGTWGSRATRPSSCGKHGPPTPPPNPAECPTSADGYANGATCSLALACIYGETTCSCGTRCRSYPVPEPPCNPDAGITTNCCDSTKTWGCGPSTRYCAADRPHVGDACTAATAGCLIDAPDECHTVSLECPGGFWQLAIGDCPVSTAKAKKEIAYLDRAAEDRLHEDLMGVGLATYRYKNGEQAQHLGFVIEDMPAGSPAVLASESRVDLYGYTSMTVASLKHQQREIDELRAEVRRLADENARLRR